VATRRIDVIKQALRSSGMLAGEVGPSGYLVAYALAETNLTQGQVVAADSVNPLGATRTAWRRVAAAACRRIVEVEVICSDRAEHRRRVETRPADIAGLAPPTWDMAQQREYEPWDRPRLVLETAGRSIASTLAELLDQVGSA